MGYKRKTFVIILFFIFLSFCHTVYADTTNDATKVMIILDASGSMWGKVDGKPKIQIARERRSRDIRFYQGIRPYF